VKALSAQDQLQLENRQRSAFDRSSVQSAKAKIYRLLHLYELGAIERCSSGGWREFYLGEGEEVLFGEE
jgi:hypothetical protein